MSLHQTTAAAFPRLYRTAAVAATDPKSWANKHIEAPNAKQLSSRCKCARWTKLNCEIRLGFNFHPKSLENKTVSPKTFPKTALSYLLKRCQICWSVRNSAAAKVIVFIRGQTVQSKVMTVLSATHHWKEEKEETSTDTLTFSQTETDSQTSSTSKVIIIIINTVSKLLQTRVKCQVPATSNGNYTAVTAKTKKTKMGKKCAQKAVINTGGRAAARGGQNDRQNEWQQKQWFTRPTELSSEAKITSQIKTRTGSVW